MDASEKLIRAYTALSDADQERVREYVAFLHWRAEQARAASGQPQGGERPWRYNFLEHLAGAEVRASRGASGMEVKIAETIVGDVSRPALWMHPPVAGEAMVEYHVAVPVGLRDLRLHFAIGVREGAKSADQLVAFRVRVDGWQVWSRAAWPATWQPFEIALPFQAGNVLRLTFATDALGSHQFAWAVWGEPELVGIEG
jgi:hypothetical protein